MTTNTNMPVFIIGKNSQGKFHIYSCSKEEATEKGHLHFPTWMKARRYLKHSLESSRSDIMLQLFRIDKDLRWIGKLKELHCHHLDELKEPLEEFKSDETPNDLQAR